MNQSTGFLDINRYAEGETVVKTVLSVLEDYRDSFNESTTQGKTNRTRVNSVIKKITKAGYANVDINELSSKKGVLNFLKIKIYILKKVVQEKLFVLSLVQLLINIQQS